MALPTPTNQPRIVGAISPGDGQMSVQVRMPTQLASRYPDKPWGTAINAIGLAKKDSDLYVGYTLVDIQPMRDSDDLLWVFEKLSSPVWTTTSLGSDSIIPEKFRSQVSLTKTLQEVVPGTAPDAITGNLMSSVVEDKQNTGKAVKVNTSETIIEDASPLVTPSLEDQLYVTTEILVAEGSMPDTGTGVIESVVEAIGKGKAIKKTRYAVLSYTDKATYTVGYATLLNESVGSADSIPAKFRALKSMKTWRLRVQAATAPTDPALGAGTGAYAGYDIVERATKQTQENGTTDVFELVVVGLSNTGNNSLDSVTYGKIVTTTGRETLDLDTQTIDTGLHIISSTIEELGNGMSVKTTEQVQGGAWPDPVEVESSKEATDLTPGKFRKSMTRSKTTKKIATIPSSIVLSGDETAKAYKQETPDRVEETTVTETLDSSVLDLEGEEYGKIVTLTTTEKLVMDGTLADTGINVISSVVDPLGNGKSIKQTKTAKGGWPDPVDIESGKETPDLTPSKFRKSVTRTKSTKKLAAIPGIITLGTNETAKVYKKETPDRVEETTVTEILDNSVVPLTGKKMGEYGIMDTSESLVDETAALPTVDYRTLGISQEPLGNGKSVLSSSTIASFPQLKGTSILEKYNIPVEVTKEVVDAETNPVGSVTGDTIIEIQPMDKWRSIKITSKFLYGDMLPENIIQDVRYQFPDQLVGINLILMFSENRVGAPSRGELMPHIIDGPAGSLEGRIYRTFHLGPPPPVSAATLWTPMPKGDIAMWSTSMIWDSTRWYLGGTIQIRPTIHSEITSIATIIDVPGDPEAAYPTLNNIRFASSNSGTMAATNITALPTSGEEALVDRNTERIRGDVWVLEETYVKMP